MIHQPEGTLTGVVAVQASSVPSQHLPAHAPMLLRMELAVAEASYDPTRALSERHLP